METITSALGFGTRVYDNILGGNLISTSNRDWIYDLVADYIKIDSGHIGYGLFYDRVLLGMDTSSYAHNIFYEITLNFGIYIGIIILFVLGAIFVRNIIKTKGTPTCAMIFAFFCFCVIELFFSSSYLRSSLFWLFIGLMISTFRKHTSLLMSHNS